MVAISPTGMVSGFVRVTSICFGCATKAICGLAAKVDATMAPANWGFPAMGRIPPLTATRAPA
eukprot:CAMPEP_0204445426 /NCGR_PEP_ID=MMETSP0470-20130426/92857_1 /ASSEMBLY_ACC=CAM_ASM_000385 /TAXON_ID=2969 /ORGANISM="Oxyrrhis marina" /LENGTH=62 /DNA_ID=CAMNT_0051444879 /DNA_START=34 /DNA_END=222 /DNA_ORIENTATION=+